MQIDRSNIKVFCVIEPWASLLLLSDARTPPVKAIETRSWFPYGVQLPTWVAISASKKPPQLQDFDDDALDAIRDRMKLFGRDRFGFGEILGVVQLHAVWNTEDIVNAGISEQERWFGDYGPNRYGWKMRYPHLFSEGIRIKGALGLFHPSEKADAESREKHGNTIYERVFMAMAEARETRGVYGVNDELGVAA